jgi:hypothetical protein
MSKLQSWIRALVIVMAAVVSLAAISPAMAAKVHLKDGKVLEGRVKREAEEFIVFVVKVGDIETTRVIARTDITKIEQDDAEKAETKATSAQPTLTVTNPKESVKIPDGATKVAFITMGETGGKDMVGPFMNTDALMHSISLLEALPTEQRPDVVVLWINSGGGALSEMLKLTETIHEKVKPKFRTAAWIESAISAAAMTAFACEEIYMMKQGNIGACTGYSMQGGRAVAMDGAGLEEVLEYMERVSSWGKRDPLIMRAMQISGERRGNQPLTCDIDADGNVSWYDGPKGEHMVCPGDEILTLNAPDSVKYGVALAVADTKAELARAMGLTEWVEVGPEADAYQQEFRDNVLTAQTRLEEFNSKLQIALQFAQSAPTRDEAERQVMIARRHLRSMKSLVDRAPSLVDFMGLTDEWFEERDAELRKMLARP